MCRRRARTRSKARACSAHICLCVRHADCTAGCAAVRAARTQEGDATPRAAPKEEGGGEAAAEAEPRRRRPGSPPRAVVCQARACAAGRARAAELRTLRLQPWRRGQRRRAACNISARPLPFPHVVGAVASRACMLARSHDSRRSRAAAPLCCARTTYATGARARAAANRRRAWRAFCEEPPPGLRPFAPLGSL
jgi:hypothetical protein